MQLMAGHFIEGKLMAFVHQCPGVPCAVHQWLIWKVAKEMRGRARKLISDSESMLGSESQFEAMPDGAVNTDEHLATRSQENDMVADDPTLPAGGL